MTKYETVAHHMRVL